MDETNVESAKGNPGMALLAGVAGWIVPGLGHLLLRRWQKALAYFLAVAMLVVVGLLARGEVFSYGSSDALDKLGFFADVGNGIFYFLAGTINAAGPDVSHAAGDYGTRLIATAGVLNLLCVLESVQIALGRGSERPVG
jgi:hypothetical protein